ncbi:hypothetical protein AJ87_26400 [Rhizobium yanglingense]|nr:hypothetical protein AJ87_26400 [Rhizobium yanglingense]
MPRPFIPLHAQRHQRLLIPASVDLHLTNAPANRQRAGFGRIVSERLLRRELDADALAFGDGGALPVLLALVVQRRLEGLAVERLAPSARGSVP